MTVRIIHADVLAGLAQLESDSVRSRRRKNGQFEKGTHWRKPKSHWQRHWLFREYVIEGRSASEIAQEMGCGDANILYWLHKHGIPVRDVSEARKLKHWGVSGADNPMHGKFGAENPNYIDGSSPERQRQYVQKKGKEFLKAIYKRDEYRCRHCGCSSRGPKSLHAHHMKPWAGNPELRFDKGNVVTLCRTCHGWVHSKRNIFGDWFA